MNFKNLLPVLLVPAILLLIPAGAMLFKAEGWDWSASDFIIMWVLLVGVGIAYKLISRKADTPAYRIATAVGLAAGFLLIWVNGAVGLIGSEDNPANALYGGVLLVGALGALLARFEPLGMFRALLATAFAQFLVPVIALFAWRHDFSPGVPQVLALNFAFVLMFVASALLFRQAAGGTGHSSIQKPA